MYLQTVELLQTEVCKTGNSQVTMVVAIVQCSNYLDDFGYLHDLGNLQLDLNGYDYVLFTVTRKKKQGKITVICIVVCPSGISQHQPKICKHGNGLAQDYPQKRAFCEGGR